jgi:hypothetical protein
VAWRSSSRARASERCIASPARGGRAIRLPHRAAVQAGGGRGQRAAPHRAAAALPPWTRSAT